MFWLTDEFTHSNSILDVARFWSNIGVEVDSFRLNVVNFFLHDRTIKDNSVRFPKMKLPAGAAKNNPFELATEHQIFDFPKLSLYSSFS